MKRLLSSAAVLLAITACDTFNDLVGDESREEKILPGERIAVLSVSRTLQADPQLEEEPVAIREPQSPANAAFEMQGQQMGVENFTLSSLDVTETANAGDGDGWESELIPAPIVGDGYLYSIDARGTISARKADDIDQLIWSNQTLLNDEIEALTGGGLAYAGGVLYATSGDGSVIALVARDGSLLWRKQADVPIRAAPAIADGKLYTVTIDNQLTAYNARTGQPEWTHRGIREAALYLGSAAPVIENGIVVVAYSSGELFALRAEDGIPIWSDSLIASRRTSASSSLTGIAASPLVRDNIVHAVSNNGIMTASLLTTGRGLWDLEVSSTHTPWLAGNYLFVISSQQHLMAIHRGQRRVKWLTDLASLYDSGDEPLRFTAPVMVNGDILLITSEGEMWWFDPQNGDLLKRTDAPGDVFTKPTLAGGRMYLIDQDATLYQY